MKFTGVKQRVRCSSVCRAGTVRTVTRRGHNDNSVFMNYDCWTTRTEGEQGIECENDDASTVQISDGLIVIYFHYLRDCGGGGIIIWADVIIVWRRFAGMRGQIRLDAAVWSVAQRCASPSVVPGTLTFHVALGWTNAEEGPSGVLCCVTSVFVLLLYTGGVYIIL